MSFPGIHEDPFYTDQLNLYYGTSSKSVDQLTDYEQALWDAFVKIYAEKTGGNITTQSTSTPAIKEAFLKFAQRYAVLHLEIDILKSTNGLPENDPAYSSLMTYFNAFYGHYTSVEKTHLWNAFLASQGLTSSPVNPAPLLEDFARFIQGIRQTEVRFEETTSRSPEEVKSRLILNDVMDSLSAMLEATQDLVSRQAGQLIFTGKWQQAYTQMMTRVPSLIPVEDPYTSVYTTVSLPSGNDPLLWDLRFLTLGYNKTQLAELIPWGIENALNKPDVWRGFGNTTMGRYAFKATTNVDTGEIEKITVRFKYGNEDFIEKDIFLLDSNGNPRVETDEFNNPRLLGFEDWIKEAEEKFKEIFVDFGQDFIDFFTDPTAIIVPSTDPDTGEPTTTTIDALRAGLSGRYLTSDIETEDFKKRSEQNAILQQYIENIRSLRTVISDRAKALQLSLGNAKEAVNKITSLWTAILEMIDEIVRSIYKEKG